MNSCANLTNLKSNITSATKAQKLLRLLAVQVFIE